MFNNGITSNYVFYTVIIDRYMTCIRRASNRHRSVHQGLLHQGPLHQGPLHQGPLHQSRRHQSQLQQLSSWQNWRQNNKSSSYLSALTRRDCSQYKYHSLALKSLRNNNVNLEVSLRRVSNRTGHVSTKRLQIPPECAATYIQCR